MSFVVDANVAVKWVFHEEDSEAAVAILEGGGLVAPELILAECANAIWKKALRGEYEPKEAAVAARAIELVDIELVGLRRLASAAVEMAIDLKHPANDCFYLALARERGLKLVTADAKLLNVLAGRSDGLAELSLSLDDAFRSISKAP